MIRTLRQLLLGFLVALSIPLHAIEVSINIIATENCGYANGKLQAVVTNGTPPYTYAWSNGSTQQIPTQLVSGNYSVVVTDDLGAQASASIFLPSGPFLESDLGVTMAFQGGAYCAESSPLGPWFNFLQQPWFMFSGVAPYTFDGQAGQAWTCDSQLAGYHVWPQGATDGDTIAVAFADANGCPGTINVTLGYEVEWPTITATSVQAACGGLSNGSIQLAIGAEGHGQTVWMQVLNEGGTVILGQNWSYTIGQAPVELTLSSLAPGTYQIVEHIIDQECSPMFGVCTSELEVVVGEEAECPCLNGILFPTLTFQITSMGQPQTANSCVNFGEYSVFGNVQSGASYQFGITENGHITVRAGAVNGPVLGEGPSPVTVTTTSASQLYVHFNADAECGADDVCHTTTVTRLLDCELPTATFEPWIDCVTGLYHVTVNVTGIGDAGSVDIRVLGEDPAYEGVGAGSYEFGPFASLDTISINVVHGDNSDCTITSPTPLLADPCPQMVVCGAPPIEEDYCYQDSEIREWIYTADGEGLINLRFLRGTIESADFDEMSIYDGSDTTGTLLFEHSFADPANLGPDGSAVLGLGFAHYGVNVFAGSGALYMRLVTDISIGCSSTPNYDPWEWDVLCGTVSVAGRAFLDDDLDCTWSSGEAMVPGTIIEVLPGPYYTTTNTEGEYFLLLNDGDYTISQLNPYVTDHCAPSPQPFTVAGGNTAVAIDFPDTAATALDMAVTMSSGPARVGFAYQQAVSVQNLSARTSGVVTLTLTVDPMIAFSNAVPAPTSVTGTTLTWELPSLQAFQAHGLQIHYDVPEDVDLIDSVIVTTALVGNVVMEDELSNNSTIHLRSITAAYDPNDKVAATSSATSGSSYYLDLDEWIDYTIRFQNTGNDTAFMVVITDTLPSVLDPTTIQPGAASHPFTWELKGQGILEFTFANILLPDSGVNEPASHGFVGFRIRAHPSLQIGEEITNTANIFFDFNPPVITEPSVLTAEFSIGIQGSEGSEGLPHLFPNPTSDHLCLHWPVDVAAPIAWYVLAIDGRSVMQGRSPFPTQGIDVGDQSNGHYILRLVAPDRSITLPFVKNTRP